MLVSLGIQIMKENLDFRKRLGREFVKEPSKIKVFILASISYAKMIYGTVFGILEKKFEHPIQIFLRFVNRSIGLVSLVLRGLGSRVVALRVRNEVSNG